MKKFLSLFLVLFAFATVALAQPGDPGGDPDCIGTWNISASPSTVANGGTVTITAHFSETCSPASGQITVSPVGGSSCITTNVSSITESIPAGVTSFVVGDFIVTNNCGYSSTKAFGITNITGGHTAGNGTSVYVQN